MLVLIVDDEPVVAQTLGMIFRKNGYATEVVNSADEAFAFAQKTSPDLVLCDIEMPLRDGLELMSDLGRELPACPILVLTGAYRSLGKIRDRAGSLGQSVSILTKPCQPTEVLRAASQLLHPEANRAQWNRVASDSSAT
jgi:CheY-like chemotaxis protein